MATLSSAPRPSRHKIALARSIRALTQEEWAERLGCSVFTVGKWERGERTPRGVLLRRLAEESGFPIEWFFEEAA